LVEEDIDILINGFGKIDNVMSNADFNENLWVEYLETMESCLPLLPSDDFAYSEPGINRKELEHNLEQLFVVNIPPELHKIYQEIGWIRNGHLKFHTIICGIWYFITFEKINKM
jgi:hypothetical protein